ncbi:MAG: DEAD/DEAH box helicase [Acidimicrobiales bacterium]
MTTTFASLGVPSDIVDALAARDITEPFEIQVATIKDSLDGRDVLGRAPTGSGKTLAFGIPLVASVDVAHPKAPKALILAPTRELADQISKELRTFAGRVRVSVVYGGVGYGPQLKDLRRGVDILVACPGRLEDLIDRGDVSLSDVNKVVLDEADRMADMGFMPAVRRLLDKCDRNRQTLLFSATLDGDVAKLTRDYQNNPVKHEIGEATPDITVAHHVFWKTSQDERTQLTADIVNAAWPSIVFCRTRHGSDRLAKRLVKLGVKAVAIHGGRSQGQRTRALDEFTGNQAQVLVATDVAARGIHVDAVASVVHFDPPADHKDYVHRSGRTARAGLGGVVVSFVQGSQLKDMRKLQNKAGLDEPFTEPNVNALLEHTPGKPPELVAKSPAQRRQEKYGDNGQGRQGRQGGSGHNGRRDDRGSNNYRGPKNKSHNRNDRDERSSRADRPSRDDRTSSGDSGRSERSTRYERSDSQASGRPERSSRYDRDGQSDGRGRSERPRHYGRNESSSASRPERSGDQRPESRERSERSDRPTRGDRNRSDRYDGGERGKRSTGSSSRPSSPSSSKASNRTANQSSGPGGRPNRKARRSHMQSND